MKNLFVLIGLIGLITMFSACSEDDLQQPETETQIAHTHEKRSCGKDAHMTKLLARPEYKASYDERMKKFSKYAASALSSRSSAAVTIPVAVHFQGISNPDASCLTAMAEDAVKALNDDFQGNNSDISKWDNTASSSFPNIQNGDANITFTLADRNHPSGFGLADGEVAVTINTTSGDSDNAWSGYLNIFVGNAGGALGYAPLGGSGNGDGVMIDKDYFSTNRNCSGVGPTAPYNKGRTLTHEVGHYLLLDHIWGGGCGQDDLVADTPDQSSDYAGCPTIGASSCGSRDLHMNYMDYTDDECMYMFTQGQTSRSENYVASNLGNLTSNASNVIGGGGGGTTGPTCEKPATLSVQNISENSAQIVWSSDAQATGYQLQYRIQGGSFTSIVTTSAQRVLTGLAAATTYEYRVRTQCPSGYTAFTAVQQFTTQNAPQGNSCDRPTSTQSEVLSEVKVKLSWASVSDAIRYQVRYRVVGTSSWSRRTTTATTRTISGLSRGATYEYQVRTRCASGWTQYTSVKTFDLGGNGGGGTGNSNGMIVEITLDDYGSETTWEIVDENGRRKASGGPYADGISGTVKTKTVQLADGCYTLYVDDAYGDGICCDYGDGSFRLIDAQGAVVGESNGQFGTFDYIDFCVEDNIAEFRRQERDNKKVGLARKGTTTH